MKKNISIFFVLLLFVCGAAFAQSAKFAAVYSGNPVIAASSAMSCDPTIDDPDPLTPDVDDPDPEFSDKWKVWAESKIILQNQIYF